MNFIVVPRWRPNLVAIWAESLPSNSLMYYYYVFDIWDISFIVNALKCINVGKWIYASLRPGRLWGLFGTHLALKRNNYQTVTKPTKYELVIASFSYLWPISLSSSKFVKISRTWRLTWNSSHTCSFPQPHFLPII